MSANRQTILSDSSMVIVDIGKTASPWARETTYLLDSIGRTTATLGNTVPPPFASSATNTVTPILTQQLSDSLVLTEISVSTGTVTSVIGTTSRTDTAFPTTSASPASTPSSTAPSSTSATIVPVGNSTQAPSGPSSPPVTMIAMGVSGAALALIMVGVASYLYRRQRRHKTMHMETSPYSNYGSGSDILEKGEFWQTAVYDQPDGMLNVSRYHTPGYQLRLKLTADSVIKAVLPSIEVRDITHFPKMRRSSGEGHATYIYGTTADEDGTGFSDIGSQDPLYKAQNSTENSASENSLSSDEEEAGFPLPFLRKAASNEEEAHRQALLLQQELLGLPQRFLLEDDAAPSGEPSESTGSTPKQSNNQSPSTAPSTLSASGSQSSQMYSSSPSTLATSVSLLVPPPAKITSILKAPSVPLRGVPEAMATTKEVLTGMSNLFKRGTGMKYVPTFAEIKDKDGGGKTNVRFGEDQIKEFGGSVVDRDSSFADADYFES